MDDAKVYTNHAKKKIIDLDDVKLASQMVLDKSFTNPPPRDVRYWAACASAHLSGFAHD